MLTNILQYLEATVQRCPDRVAVAGELGALTFLDLHCKARSLGTGLLARKLGGQPLAILMSRGPEVFPAMLGTVYAGAYYTVLDPEMPLQRLERILASLEPGAVICDEAGAGVLAGLDSDLRILSCRALMDTTPNDRALDRVRTRQTDQDPVYVVFTSGSTGEPKGVVGSHRGVLDYIEGLCQVLPFGEDTVFGSQSPLYFDAYMKEWIPVLKFGARMELIPQRLFLTPVALVDYLKARRVNTLCWVASALSLVSSLGTLDLTRPEEVHTVAFASEVLPPVQLQRWRKALPQARFYNLYGPTEATGICCCYPVDRTFGPGDRIPVGHPLPNTGVLLLNSQGKPCGPEEPGEICIYGSRLTLGYWSMEQGGFSVDPAAPYPRRIYRTGDLGRWNSRGELEFLGRLDSQIKHMGHRIELGEIEARAQEAPGIREAGCVYIEGSIRLYYAGDLEPAQLAAHLRSLLPRYMIPHRIRKLTGLPRRENGKLDRKKLAQCG